MKMNYIMGYCNKISVKPGEEIEFMLSAEGYDSAQTQLVKLIHGDEHPDGPGFIEKEIGASCDQKISLSKQFTQVGSFASVVDADGKLQPENSFTLHAFICPTTPDKAQQGIITRWSQTDKTGFGLGIESGSLCFWLGDGSSKQVISSDAKLSPKTWYFVAASYDADNNQVSLFQAPVVNSYNSHLNSFVIGNEVDAVSKNIDIKPEFNQKDIILAGYHDNDEASREVVNGLYNGKIDRPGMQNKVLAKDQLELISNGGEVPEKSILAFWNTSVGYTDDGIGDIIVDTGPHKKDAIGYNRPVRGMTGYNWKGKDDCFRLSPEQYGGVHFHDDSIIDCRWNPTLKWTVSDDLKSGVYALRLRADGYEDHVTFFVRPKKPQAKIAMLMPTASYLAYSNEHFILHAPGVEVITGHVAVLSDYDYLLAQHPEWGLSSYDHHSDGAGVCYVSYLRPIMGMRPKHRMAATGVAWQFPADLSIIYWLEQQGFDYDVITDEDLHKEGLACLEPYKAVLNGTHSEYYSESMLDATEQYIAQGGNVMYMGGNGYYWVIAFRDDELPCMEIRKLDVGSRAWQAEPGEYYMTTTGEKGGLWRIRGRSPQKLLGVGFTSEGMDESKPYRRMPDSYQPKVSWIFEGAEDEVFGDYGLALNGAAGIEIDRYDLSLGTPPGTFLLASSEGHSDNYPFVSDEIAFNYPGTGGTQHPQVRADVTYYEMPGAGKVFCTGSIAWGQALPCNDGDNGVSRITENVLKKFSE